MKTVKLTHGSARVEDNCPEEVKIKHLRKLGNNYIILTNEEYGLFLLNGVKLRPINP